MNKLETQIAGEIKNDELAAWLSLIASGADVHRVLEIGTGSGDGSTAHIASGMIENPNPRKQFLTIEVSPARARHARSKYQNLPFMIVLSGCSVYPHEYATETEIRNFYETHKTALNQYPIEQVLQWRTEELEYIKSNAINSGVLGNLNMAFDMVLIDGSEFTAAKELPLVLGAKYIVLDDVNSFKNWDNHETLAKNPDYALHASNPKLRNGYSIFRHK